MEIMRALLLLACLWGVSSAVVYSIDNPNGIMATNNVAPTAGCDGAGGNVNYQATLSSDATWNSDTTILSFTLSWSTAAADGFNATNIHIHMGDASSVGPVIVTICSGVADCELINGVPTMLNLTATSFNPSDVMYLNLHSAPCPSGAARGQIVAFPETQAPTGAPTNAPTQAPTAIVPATNPNGLNAQNNLNPTTGCNGTDGNANYQATLSATSAYDTATQVLSLLLSWPTWGMPNGFNPDKIHVHQGDASSTGALVVAMCDGLSACTPLNGVLTPLNMTGTGYDPFGSQYYINFHSSVDPVCPSGTARGQLLIANPTDSPTMSPTDAPTASPTISTGAPTAAPTNASVTAAPTAPPSPTSPPSPTNAAPTNPPSTPTTAPTDRPTDAPSGSSSNNTPAIVGGVVGGVVVLGAAGAITAFVIKKKKDGPFSIPGNW